MPRYFFHLRDHSEEVLDTEGHVIADMAALRTVVMLNARDVITGFITTQGLIDFRYRIDAEDEAGGGRLQPPLQPGRAHRSRDCSRLTETAPKAAAFFLCLDHGLRSQRTSLEILFGKTA